MAAGSGRRGPDGTTAAQDLHHPHLAGASTTLGGTSNISLEILEGRDESIDVGDFMGMREWRPAGLGLHRSI